MKLAPHSLGFLCAAVILSGFARGDDAPVEPYSSQPKAGEMAFIARWTDFLLHRGAASERYPADLPFSFKCGARSSREWVRVETAQVTSGDWQDDCPWTNVLAPIGCPCSIIRRAATG